MQYIYSHNAVRGDLLTECSQMQVLLVTFHVFLPNNIVHISPLTPSGQVGYGHMMTKAAFQASA